MARSFLLISARRSYFTQGLISTSLKKSTQLATRRAFSSSEQNDSWSKFFELRKAIRRWEISSGIFFSGAIFTGSCYYLFSVADFDPMEQIMGIDPYILYMVTPGALAVIGYAAGMASGSIFWRLLHKKESVELVDKFSKNLYNRIMLYRAPEAMNISPIPRVRSPDYYGEKILSKYDYRKWLKKQKELSNRSIFKDPNFG